MTQQGLRRRVSAGRVQKDVTMPITLAPVSRRSFLGMLGAGAGWLCVRPVFAAGADPNRVALLSDTHIPDAPERGDFNCNMTDRLRRVVDEIRRFDPKPACAVITGDLAWKLGTPGEYARFAKEVEPLAAATIPLHLGLGNHDTRAAFLEGMKIGGTESRPVAGKHVLIVDLPRADLVILDSLEPRLGNAGECGAAQLMWLGNALDRHATKPALVFVHHNPQWSNNDGKGIGLTDTPGLWDVLKARPRVKALFFGHTHTYRIANKDGIQLVNLPAAGYPFKPTEVTGWVDLTLQERAVSLTVHALDAKHAQHLQTTELSW